jgi:predicted  nucleic acid-binding Zn-ribbon protein
VLLQTNETQRDELPGEIQQLQSRCSDIGQLLVDAEKKLEALNDDCRGDREAIVRQQQVVLSTD